MPDAGRRQLRTRAKPGRFSEDPAPKRKKKHNPAAQPLLRLSLEESKLKDWEVAADLKELVSAVSAPSFPSLHPRLGKR